MMNSGALLSVHSWEVSTGMVIRWCVVPEALLRSTGVVKLTGSMEGQMEGASDSEVPGPQALTSRPYHMIARAWQLPSDTASVHRCHGQGCDGPGRGGAARSEPAGASPPGRAHSGLPSPGPQAAPQSHDRHGWPTWWAQRTLL